MKISVSIRRWWIVTGMMVAWWSAGNSGRASDLLDIQAVREPLPWFDSEPNHPAYDRTIRDLRPNATAAVTSEGRPPLESPIALRLSRFHYPLEDGHLDALVRFDMDLDDQPRGQLHIELLDATGTVLSNAHLDSIPGSQLHFSYRIPDQMAGANGSLRVTWQQRRRTAGSAQAEFEVAPATDVVRTGRIALSVPNSSHARVAAAPITVGVPFPRGALMSADHIRLVDADGTEIPLQAVPTAHWSRFGSVKWVLCDFTVDLEGAARTLYLEYGPDVHRTPQAALAVSVEDGWPTVDAGRLRWDGEGLWLQPAVGGDPQPVLTRDALVGAFVEHTRGVNMADAAHSHIRTLGRQYFMGDNLQFEVEELGPEKVVLRTEGYYTQPGSDATFCRFVVRYVMHRNSPIMRIFHTWIYTGDGNRDPIRNMGWRFGLQGLQPAGFLSAFDPDAAWLDGYYLRQDEHDAFTWFSFDAPRAGRRMVFDDAVPRRPLQEEGRGTRAPGVMSARNDGAQLFVGVQDFWQNFPSSLACEEDALTFYQWPRYGRERQHSALVEGVAHAWRLWFVHEGETLNFRLPQELTENPIYQAESRAEGHISYGQPDSINAQGVAKTAEMWLYLTGADEAPADAVRVMQGLNEESLRAVVDPRWMADSGAFYEMAAEDHEAYPEYEEGYAEGIRSPLRQIERMGVYGKWIYGDLLRPANLDTLTAGLYRTFRKAHWGWPYSWTQFVRSGDLDLLRAAQAATRMMTDTAFCHYVSEEMEQFMAEELEPRALWATLQPFRRIGWHNRNLIPWAGYWGPSTRCYVDQADYLWDAWLISGYHRARDVALTWAEQTKIEEADKMMRGPINAAQNRARWPANLQKQYIEMYEQTWDPWFLAAAQAIADLHLWRHREEGYNGHVWHAGILTWHRYSRCPDHAELVNAHIDHWTDWHAVGWGTSPATLLPCTVFGYAHSGNDYYVRRAAGILDMLRWSAYSGEDFDYYRGMHLRQTPSQDLLMTSWQQLWHPWAIRLFNEAGGLPADPVQPSFVQHFGPDDRVLLYKLPDEELRFRVAGAFALYGPDGELVSAGEAPDAGTSQTSTGWTPLDLEPDPLADLDELDYDDDTWVLPADAPAGLYTVTLTARRGGSTRLPLSQPDTPELFLPGGDGTIGSGVWYTQHWFKVPDGVESFSVDFDNIPFFRNRQSVRQVIIWSPDGEEVWAHRERAVDYDPEQQVLTARIDVAPDQSGRLWRITQPGERSLPFRLDPALPQAVTHEPLRWFDR